MNILTQMREAFSLKYKNARGGNMPRNLNHINTMKEGTVKFFNNSKGFGFIENKEGNDIFVHISGLIDEIRDNDRVTYEEEQGKKGMNAVNVKLL